MITYFFKTYGCQANVADSERLATFLKTLGSCDVTQEQDADIIVINTCAVRDKAEQKLFSYLGQLAEIKKSNPFARIGVIGCVASYKKDEIYKRFDHVTFVYGAKDDYKTLEAYLADLVTSLETTKQLYEKDATQAKEEIRRGQDRDIKKIMQSRSLFKAPTLSAVMFKKTPTDLKPFTKKSPELIRSFVNIMTGCNKFCAYCIVPFTRGREVSYPIQEIVERVAHDLANGAREITLIGQNVNSYRDPVSGADFPELLRQVVKLEGSFWVRWISPHPQDMTVELFDVIAQYRDKIPPYVHFPVQSGSSRVLELMKRNYTIELYKEQIGWLRDRLPDATISTDIIVGFPGETEEDFEQTYRLIEEIRFDWIYSFIYSKRKHTFAARMEDNCPDEVKSARLERLQKRQVEISYQLYSKHVGKTFKVLVEKRLQDGRLLARTEGNIRVLFQGSDELINNFTFVSIEEAGPVNLIGRQVMT